MIEWSLDAFGASESVRSIVVAVPPGHGGDLRAHDLGGDLQVVAGGATRSQSVFNALAAVTTELVAIHDAARPLLTPALVDDLLAVLDQDPEAAGVIAAAPLTDTVKQVGDGSRTNFSDVSKEKLVLDVERTVDRSRLWGAQTPQVFRTEVLRRALEVEDVVRDAATDEAALVEAAGGRVLIHPVAEPNPKVTTPLDLRFAEQLLADRAGPGRDLSR
jgi:2-C-methyl-D-erythritol 4-phosphate cytidylyltransferase